jgi:hypothetical protein
MGRYLDQNIGFWQVKRCVGNFADKDGVHFGIELEVLQNLNPLILKL